MFNLKKIELHVQKTLCCNVKESLAKKGDYIHTKKTYKEPPKQLKMPVKVSEVLKQFYTTLIKYS